jgi:hypothetical protein
MTNHPNRSAARNFELTFVGGAMARYFPRYRRWHPTKEAAEAEGDRVFQKLSDDGLPTACHQMIIYPKAL